MLNDPNCSWSMLDDLGGDPGIVRVFGGIWTDSIGRSIGLLACGAGMDVSGAGTSLMGADRVTARGSGAMAVVMVLAMVAGILAVVIGAGDGILTELVEIGMSAWGALAAGLAMAAADLGAELLAYDGACCLAGLFF